MGAKYLGLYIYIFIPIGWKQWTIVFAFGTPDKEINK